MNNTELNREFNLNCANARLAAAFLTLTIVCLTPAPCNAQGFSEPSIILYGKIQHVGGGSSFQLFDGELAFSFKNARDASNSVRLETKLKPTGDPVPEFSYAIEVPLMYLPNERNRDEFLSTRATETSFDFASIEVNGSAASVTDGNMRSLKTSFRKRASQIRLDLQVDLPQDDTDGDGLPDWWEELHGLSISFAGDATLDNDGDQLSNLEEFLGGTDPNIRNSAPTLFTTNLTVPEGGKGGVALNMVDTNTTTAGIEYTLQSLDSGFALLKSGAELRPGETFSQGDVESGAIVLAHRNRNVRSGSMALEYTDGTTASSSTLALNVYRPSATDGSGAKVWLDASTLNAADGAKISSWPDSSGHGNTAEQAISANQPTFSAANGGSIDFSGTTAHLFLDDTAFPNLEQHTFFSVFESSESPNLQSILQTNTICLQVQPNDGPVSYLNSAVYRAGNHRIEGHSKVTGARVVQSARITGGSGHGQVHSGHDGLAAMDTTAKDPVFPALGMKRATTSATNFTNVFSGKLHELLAFPSSLTDIELQSVSDYLHSKWNGAVIWNASAETKPVSITAGGTTDILRGGWGADTLNAGPGNDVISGGGGNDMLTGGSGRDRFSFSSVDTGTDTIRDFDPNQDTLDLSNIFSGATGDLRNFLSLRVTVAGGAIATVVNLDLDGNGRSDQEIVLEGTSFSDADLAWLSGERIIETGGLVIPETVTLVASEDTVDENTTRVVVNLTRSGNVAHAETIPLSVAGTAERNIDYRLGSVGGSLLRPTVTFARGQTRKTIIINPALDPITEQTENITLTVLPSSRYDSTSATASLNLIDGARIFAAVIVPHALRNGSVPAVIAIRREGRENRRISVPLEFGGDAANGRDYEFIEPEVTFEPFQKEVLVSIVPKADAVSTGSAKLVQVSVVPNESAYASLDPWLASVLIVDTNANGLLTLADWKARVAPGNRQSLAAFSRSDPDGDALNNFQEYALSTNPNNANPPRESQLEIFERAGFINLRLGTRADVIDVDYILEASTDFKTWSAAGSSFTSLQEPYTRGKIRRVWRSVTPATAIDKDTFYKVRLAGSTPASTATNASKVLGIGEEEVMSAGNTSWKPSESGGAMLSGAVGDNQRSDLVMQIEGPTTLRFEWMVSSEFGNDALKLLIDGIEHSRISGSVDWTEKSVTIPRGKHEVRLSYHKNASGATGADHAGVRTVSF